MGKGTPPALNAITASKTQYEMIYRVLKKWHISVGIQNHLCSMTEKNSQNAIVERHATVIATL